MTVTQLCGHWWQSCKLYVGYLVSCDETFNNFHPLQKFVYLLQCSAVDLQTDSFTAYCGVILHYVGTLLTLFWLAMKGLISRTICNMHFINIFLYPVPTIFPFSKKLLCVISLEFCTIMSSGFRQSDWMNNELGQ